MEHHKCHIWSKCTSFKTPFCLWQMYVNIFSESKFNLFCVCYSISRGGATPKVLVLTAYVDIQTRPHPPAKGLAIALIAQAPKSTADKVHSRVNRVIWSSHSRRRIFVTVTLPLSPVTQKSHITTKQTNVLLFSPHQTHTILILYLTICPWTHIT